MMAESVLPVKHLQDITECPICTDFYSDPRSLPCIHTYCLKCIKSWVENYLSKDKVPCPMCRQEFAIPEKGIGELPKNIFVGKLLAVKELSSRRAETVVCDLCHEDNEIESTKGPAKFFCIECQQNLCVQCGKLHSKIKASRSHQTYGIGDEMEDSQTKCMPSNCEKHAKKLKIYCFDCQKTLCIVCFITQHTGHKAADIGEVVGDFKAKVDCGISKLAKVICQLNFSLNKLQQSRSEIVNRFNRVECEINKKADAARAIIERQRQQLLHENNELRASRVKEVENVFAEVVQNKTMAESLKNYCVELLKKGSSSDIARETKGVCTRVEEMEKLCPAGVRPVMDTVIKFTSSDKISDSTKCIGRVESSAHTCLLTRDLSPSLAHSDDGLVCAVTCINDELFVTRAANKAHDQIAVYDQSTLQLVRHITIAGATGHLYGLAGCPRNNCLYVSDYNNSSVHKVNLSMTSSAATKLFAVEKPIGLSVNGSGNVLVAAWTKKIILEYRENGSFVREISVNSSLWHAVELNGGAIAVSVNDSEFHGVCCISSEGRLQPKYYSTRKLDGRRMSHPRGLAVGSQGFVLVADQNNGRIVAFDPTFSDARQVAFDVTVKEPMAICLDESRGRLYVGESCEGGRLLVFDNVFNVSSAFNK